MIKDQTALTKIKRARTGLLLHHPFFANLALRLRMKEDYTCKTAWTDGEVFAYNPHYINMLPREKLLGLAAHIVMHPACNHHKRRNGRDKSLWNEACDYVINPILLDAGLSLPDGFLFDDAFAKSSAEAVYSVLANAERKDPEEADDSQESNHDPDEASGEEDQEGRGEQGEKTEARGDNESEDGDPGMSGEIRDGGEGAGLADEGGGEETDWDDAVIQAAINARGLGNLPAALERFVNARLSPSLDWRALLARFVANHARSDYSWLAPNKRYIHHGLYLPALKNSEIDEVFIAIDTSGSVTEPELQQFTAEIFAIFSQYPTSLTLLHCDNRLQKVEHLNRCDFPQRLIPSGGGGTDYRPVFAYIQERGKQPSCLIYLTDLECKSYPPKPPAYPVLWVQAGEIRKEAPFGETIHLH